MTILINILVLLISIYVLIRAFRNSGVNTLYLCLIIFDASYIFPLLIELFLGRAYTNTGYRIFQTVQHDVLTNVFFYLFLLLIQFIFYMGTKKQERLSQQSIRDQYKEQRYNFCVSRNHVIIMFIAVVMCISLILAWLCAPDPLEYFTHFGQINSEVRNLTKQIVYHNNVLSKFERIAVIGCILLKYGDLNNRGAGRLFRIIIVFFVMVVDGKRTLPFFLILLLLFMDLINSENVKKSIIEVFSAVAAILVFFIAYSFSSGKYYYDTNWYSVMTEYFFKGVAVKTAIYSRLNRGFRILDYSGQTIIFDLFYFIPRTIWPSKPVTYPVYYTAAVTGYTDLSWRMQPGCYSEWIANLGLLGAVLCPILISFFCKHNEKLNSVAIKFLGIFFIVIIQVYEYADILKVLFAIWLLAVLWNRINNQIYLRRQMRGK